MDILIAFFASFLLLVTLGLAIVISRKSFKRVDEFYFVDCLRRCTEGQITSNEWLVFLSLPIKHDPWLEELKMELLEINEEYGVRTVATGHLPAFLMDERGLQQVKSVLDRVAKRPYKDF
jgi:hypothetical protein